MNSFLLHLRQNIIFSPWTLRGCKIWLCLHLKLNHRPPFLLAHHEVASWAFIHFLKHVDFLLVSGLLYLLFLLPGKFSESSHDWFLLFPRAPHLKHIPSCSLSNTLFRYLLHSQYLPQPIFCSFLIYSYDWYISSLVRKMFLICLVIVFSAFGAKLTQERCYVFAGYLPLWVRLLAPSARYFPFQ